MSDFNYTRVPRINLYGGPGTGKSLLAAHLYDALRRDGVIIELVQEAIKPMAYRGEVPGLWRGKEIFAEQFRRESDWLLSGVPCLVTDSPLFLQCYYMASGNCPEVFGCIQHANDWEQAYPSLNLYLTRDPAIEFQKAGRYQDLKGAQRIDETLLAFLRIQGVEVVQFVGTDRKGIFDFVRQRVPRDQTEGG